MKQFTVCQDYFHTKECKLLMNQIIEERRQDLTVQQD